MNNILLACLLSFATIAFVVNGSPVNGKENELEKHFNQLKVEQGIASFVQKKHFAFLSSPMISSGTIKVYQGNIIWQVESPIFSKQVIIGDQIWQLEDKASQIYQPVVSHASIENLVKAIFSGEVDQSQWQISLLESQCLAFIPNDAVLANAISQLEVCLTDGVKQRQVKLTDAQNNLTEILVNFTNSELTEDDIEEFNFKR